MDFRAPLRRASAAPFLVAASLWAPFPTAAAQWNSNQFARIHPLPNDLEIGADFGDACDLSGATLVVGASWHDGAGTNSGGAYVFADTGSGWAQQAKLAPSGLDGGDRLGASVAIDGDTLAVGSPYDEMAGQPAAGVVYVFVRSGTTWTEQAALVAGDSAAHDHFGTSVSLEGDTLVIGAQHDDGAGGSNVGSAYVFARAGAAWVEQAKLVAPSAVAEDLFGASVALSGSRIVVGVPGSDASGTGGAGAAMVFELAGSAWGHVATLVSSLPGAGAKLGASVALDGGTAAAGAPFDDIPSTDAGSVSVFVGSGSSWSEQARLVDFGPIFNDRLGSAVDLEGDRLVAGLPYSGSAGLATGGVALFVRAGTTWSGAIEIVGSDCDGNDFLGSSAAISGDLVAGGAPSGETPPSGLPTGEAYVFALVPPPLIEVYCTAKTNSLGCVPRIGSSGNPSASNPVPFEVTCVEVLNLKPGILFYGTAPSSSPFQGGTKCVLSPVRRTPVRHSGGNPPPAADCSGAYSYDFNARIQGGSDAALVAGALIHCQYWSRDPASPSTTGLSDALRFRIDP